MIGVVVVTHGQLANELVNAAEMIVGDLPQFAAVSIGWHDEVNDAREEIAGRAAALAAQHPETHAGRRTHAIPLLERILGPARQLVLVAFAAVSCVLLIGIANLVNLQLARNAAREREVLIVEPRDIPRDVRRHGITSQGDRAQGQAERRGSRAGEANPGRHALPHPARPAPASPGQFRSAVASSRRSQ